MSPKKNTEYLYSDNIIEEQSVNPKTKKNHTKISENLYLKKNCNKDVMD